MSKWDYIVEEMRLEDDWFLLEAKDRLIDRLPSLDDAQKAQMKQFFAKRPNLESKFDWNRPDSITWDAFQNIASGYEEPIDPDTVPEFSDKRDEGDGIVSYEVQDDRAGQYAVRRIIDTHWGKDANPWCLLAYQDGTLSQAWDYWMQYSALPKRVAFKDGKLLTFMATDGDYATVAKQNPNLPLFIFREMVFNGYGKPINGQISDITTDDDAQYLSDETIDYLMKEISGELKNGNSLPEALHKIMYDGYDIFDWVYKNKKKFSIVELNPRQEIWWDRIDKPHLSVHDCA